MSNKFKKLAEKKMDYHEKMEFEALKLKDFLEKNSSKMDRVEISKQARLEKFPSNDKDLNKFEQKIGIWLHPHEKTDMFYVSLCKKIK